MAANGEVRDPSSHRTKSQIRKMDRTYNSRPENIKRRDNDNKARKMLGLKKGDPRDAAHKKAQRHGGATTRANIKPVHRSKNRGWRDGGDV